jgi:hypothetical protein
MRNVRPITRQEKTHGQAIGQVFTAPRCGSLRPYRFFLRLGIPVRKGTRTRSVARSLSDDLHGSACGWCAVVFLGAPNLIVVRCHWSVVQGQPANRKMPRSRSRVSQNLGRRKPTTAKRSCGCIAGTEYSERQRDKEPKTPPSACSCRLFSRHAVTSGPLKRYGESVRYADYSLDTQ